MKETILNEMKNQFRPEFLNRVDEVIVFNQLSEDDNIKIVNIMLKQTIDRLKEKNIYLDYDESINKFLINKNRDKEFGARPLRRIITREIEDKISDEFLKGDIKIGDRLKILCSEEGLTFSHQ